MGKELYSAKWYQKYRVLLHLIFWMLTATMYLLTYERVAGSYAILFVAKDLLAVIIAFYVFSYFIVPSFLKRGNVWIVISYVAASYFWWCAVSYVFCYSFTNFFIGAEQVSVSIKNYLDYMLEGGFWALAFNKSSTMIMDFAYLMILPLSIKLTKELVKKNNEKVKLERDYLRMEINFLKSQINPHFLLNSLNTINALVEEEHPYTQDAIGNLGGILSYTLYTGSDEKVQLSKELAVITDYLAIQEYRFGDRVETTLDIPKAIPDILISPHVFFPFVENAFKHGVEKIRTGAVLQIRLTVADDGSLCFEVKNNFPEMIRNETAGGIGLQNLNRRLDIFYKGRYNLKIHASESIYSIKLVLKP